MCRFNVGDHVALVKSADYRNHYVVAAVLAPGEALKDSWNAFVSLNCGNSSKQSIICDPS